MLTYEQKKYILKNYGDIPEETLKDDKNVKKLWNAMKNYTLNKIVSMYADLDNAEEIYAILFKENVL